MKRLMMIIGVMSALALLLIAGCQTQHRPIGGDKDEGGCLVGAGYSWNETIGACVRPWELNEGQAKAAQIAVAPISARPITVIEVIQARCSGCFRVKLQTGDGAQYTVTLINWAIAEDNACPETCPLLSQPAPSFCTDGTIIPGQKDECGCTGPPSCISDCAEEQPNCLKGSVVITYIGADGCPHKTCVEQVTCTAEQKAAEICTMEYMPVCGDDGVTYGNKCSACASKKIDSYTQGGCPGETDGKLKANDCTEPRTQACTKEYMPVCGWFGQDIQCIRYPCAADYGNKCMACADEKIAYWTEGECPE